MNYESRAQLTEREVELLSLIADGYANKQICEKLGISLNTVESHNRSIIKILKAKNMKHALSIAFRNGILK